MGFFHVVSVPVGRWGRHGLAVATGTGEWMIATNHPRLALAGELWIQEPAKDANGKPTGAVVVVTFQRDLSGGRRRVRDHDTVAEAVVTLLSGPEWWTEEEAVFYADEAARKREERTQVR